MIVAYDTEVQGRELLESEIQQLKELDAICGSFSDDEPELTEELVKRMRLSGSFKRKKSK